MRSFMPAIPAAFVVVGLTLASGVAAHAQSQTTVLHDALNLTVAQDHAWQDFQASVGPDPKQEAQQRQTARLVPTLPTPRRLALIRAQMQADLEAFDRNATAVQTFYALLTPDQQATFDRMTQAQGAGPGAPRPR
ncbi:hypothetical protein BH09PSE2_BH09PSE2_09190 [soil metagenome]